MAGFKTDLFKASVLAVMTAILLGAATYVLSAQIEMAGQEGLEPPAAGFGVRSSTIRATGL